MKIKLVSRLAIFTTLFGLNLAHAEDFTDHYLIGDLEIKLVNYSTDQGQWPSRGFPATENYKIIGGGARVNYTGSGALLTGMYPIDPTHWFVSAKDHIDPVASNVTGFLIMARLKNQNTHSPISNDDYIIVTEQSALSAWPQAEAILPNGYELVGGGAEVLWKGGAGNLLTASYPGNNSWIAKSKDHIIGSPAKIISYAIGLKSTFLQNHYLKVQRKSSDSGTPTAAPTANCYLDQGYRLLSGGAEAIYQGSGQLLTASYPLQRQGWRASAKDHIDSDPGRVRAYCIGISGTL